MPQLLSLHPRATKLQLLKPIYLEPVFHNERGHHSEKLVQHDYRVAHVQLQRPSIAINE